MIIRLWLLAGAAGGMFAVAAADGSAHPIDAVVLPALKAQGLTPSERCSDEMFLRRVYLDVIGTLPTVDEARTFIADVDPEKRTKLIDALLQRPEFAECLGLKWGDLLRVKSEFPSNLWPNAVQAYDRWIRESFRANKPYDQFVRELLTASGSNFRAPPANFYRAFQERTPRKIADNVALLFMGLRLESAGWSSEQLLGFSACFAKLGYKNTDEWKEEIVFFNPTGVLAHPTSGKPVLPATPDGRVLELKPGQDPRVALAQWLTAPGNPWFAKAMSNRIWFWLTGRGIVQEPDDMRPDNPPWSPELLALLEKELVQHKFDLKSVYRLILTSGIYQLSSDPSADNAADDSGFSHYRLRRLDAEPLLDAINQITGGSEKYSSSIPEPFTFLPDDQRAIKLADGSIEHPFLELFGRPARNTSYESERAAAPSVFQAQHLLNSSHVQKKLEKGEPWKKLLVNGKGKKPDDPGVAKGRQKLIEELYLRILSRFPTTAERGVAVAYLANEKRTPAESATDLAWALINSKEFILKH